MMAARRVLLVLHGGREEAVHAALDTAAKLKSAGISPVFTLDEDTELSSGWAAGQYSALASEVLGRDCELPDIELAMVLGGDGTFLKAAEVVRLAKTPLLGVNLGHVGFLADTERHELDETVSKVVDQDYLVSERLALEVEAMVAGQVTYRSWALNEVTVEKRAPERMLEVVMEVDRRPLSSFGCDGVVISTPTGSTAYAFSAGGPVVWPSVEAMLVVPLAAHALFARPMVVSPNSLVAVEVLQRSSGHGVLWCDGRRTHELPPGARVVVKRSDVPIRVARLSASSFTDRLVRKFSLPVSGWRGPSDETKK